MGKKNPNLCERPYCRERWTVLVKGWSRYFGGRRWELQVCPEHAGGYDDGQDSVGNWTAARSRDEANR